MAASISFYDSFREFLADGTIDLDARYHTGRCDCNGRKHADAAVERVRHLYAELIE